MTPAPEGARPPRQHGGHCSRWLPHIPGYWPGPGLTGHTRPEGSENTLSSAALGLTQGYQELGAPAERAKGGSSSRKPRRQPNAGSQPWAKGHHTAGDPGLSATFLSPYPLNSGQASPWPTHLEAGRREPRQQPGRVAPRPRAGGRRGRTSVFPGDPGPAFLFNTADPQVCRGLLFQGIVGASGDTKNTFISTFLFILS